MRRAGPLAALVLAPAVALSGATGAGFLNVPLSAQQAGMGGVTAGGSDSFRAWSNPALLSSLSTRGEVGVNGGSFLDGGNSGLGACAGWRLDSRWSVGAGFSSSSARFDEVDQWGDYAGGAVSASQTALAVMGAMRLGAASVGLAVKTVSDSTMGNGASTVAGDLGVSGELGGIVAGAAVRNLGGGIRPEGDGAEGGESLPLQIRAGAAYRIVPLGLLVGLEYASAEGVGTVGAGVEWRANRMFAVRAGASGAEYTTRVTAGLSARVAGIGLDYAALTHPLGITHQVGVSYGFGGAVGEAAAEIAEAPAPAEQPAESVTGAPSQPAPASKPAVATGAGLLNMAVSDLGSQGVSASDAAVISELLRAELVKQRKFNVVEKGSMEKILAEQAFQQSGCTTEECAVKIGRLLNVQRMVMGSFGKLMDKYFVNLRVVNVENGAIIFADSAKGRTVEDIEAGILDLAKKISKQVR